MGIGGLIFMVPHFTGEPNPGISLVNDTSDNICRGVPLRDIDLGLGRLSNGLSHRNLREDNCIEVKSSTFGPVLLFVIAQMLLGCGGSPLFTLGTTYVDDHVRTESASIYIGFMYSMGAFGPVLGFLLGAYLLSFHMDTFSGKPITISMSIYCHLFSCFNKIINSVFSSLQILAIAGGWECGGVDFYWVDFC